MLRKISFLLPSFGKTFFLSETVCIFSLVTLIFVGVFFQYKKIDKMHFTGLFAKKYIDRYEKNFA